MEGLFMFGGLRHKKEVRRIEREQELSRLKCNHSWYYAGIEYDDFHGGSSVDTTRYYVDKCSNCGASKKR